MEIQVLAKDTFETALPLGRAWGYSREAFERLVTWTDGCGRLIVDGDQAIGMALGFPWGEVGWIGDVLVLDEHRGQGLGGQVTEATVAALHDHGCTTVKLYATPKAIGLYERLGFVGEAEYTIARGSHRRGRDPEVEPLADHLSAALELDRAIFPGDRSTLLRRQASDHPEVAIALVDDAGDLLGFGMARPAADLTEIGPVVVRDGQARYAQALVDGLLVRVPEGDVEVTYPTPSWAAKSAWGCRGFMAVDTPLEMRLGPTVDEDRDAMVATGGQELG